jgi:leucine dehydrogenase
VGRWLATKLAEEGAVLTVCDTSRAALEALRETLRETGRFREVPPDAICDVECELFAPCAIGGAVDTDTAKRIKASVVAGSANNILSGPAAGATLMARGITYAPDFLVNAGALVQGVRFLLKGERRSPDAILDIGKRTTQLLEKARDRDVPPEALLEEVTRERLELGSI